MGNITLKMDERIYEIEESYTGLSQYVVVTVGETPKTNNSLMGAKSLRQKEVKDQLSYWTERVINGAMPRNQLQNKNKRKASKQSSRSLFDSKTEFVKAKENLYEEIPITKKDEDQCEPLITMKDEGVGVLIPTKDEDDLYEELKKKRTTIR